MSCKRLPNSCTVVAVAAGFGGSSSDGGLTDERQSGINVNLGIGSESRSHSGEVSSCE